MLTELLKRYKIREEVEDEILTYYLKVNPYDTKSNKKICQMANWFVWYCYKDKRKYKFYPRKGFERVKEHLFIVYKSYDNKYFFAFPKIDKFVQKRIKKDYGEDIKNKVERYKIYFYAKNKNLVDKNHL